MNSIITSDFHKTCAKVLMGDELCDNEVCIQWYALGAAGWLNADAIAEAGGLVDYLKEMELPDAYIAELMNRDYEYMDATGLANKCLGTYGSFDWEKFQNILDISDKLDAEIIEAALDLGIPVNEISDAYIGEFEDDESFAQSQWENDGRMNEIPDFAIGYIDWESVANDMKHNSEFQEERGYYFFVN